MYTVTQIDYLAISKSNTLALVMAASDRGGGQRGKSRVKLCFEQLRGHEGDEEDHGGEEGHAPGKVQHEKERVNAWTSHFLRAYHMLH